MNRQETIEAVCEIVELAYRSIANFDSASDCFCNEPVECDLGNTYRNEGKAIDYVRTAVLEALKRDGFEIASPYNATTGRVKS